jgi:hypothetical protein
MTREHRIYKTVEVEVWDDSAFRRLSPLQPSGQALWLYLLTGRRTTKIPGVVVARPAVLADDLRWPLPSLELCLGEAIDEGLAKADTEAGIVWLPRALRHSDGTPRKSTKPTSLNHFKGWAKGWERIPECSLKGEIWREVKALAYALSDAYVDAFAHAFPDGIAYSSAIQVAGSSKQVAGSREQDSPRASREVEIPTEALDLARLLVTLIADRLPDSSPARKPEAHVKRWAPDLDKLHRLDGHSWDRIREVLEWSQTDSFWQGNILSAGKLRKQFDALMAKMAGRKRGGPTPGTLAYIRELEAEAEKERQHDR